ncbi:MAG: hypothetical protein GX986_09610 [Firmicutes bacterium]|nr:hypothetical protein [Bacillota bacterium]
MKVTILGTSSSSGLPTYMCDCEACIKALQDGMRRRQSMTSLEVNGAFYLVDCGFDPILAGVVGYHQKIDGIFLSHLHLDHMYGLYSPNWRRMRGEQIPVYHSFDQVSDEDALDVSFFRPFSRYVARQQRFDFRSIGTWEEMELPGVRVTCLPLRHDKHDSAYYTSAAWGYLFEDLSSKARFAYLCDTLGLDQEVAEFLREKKVDLAIIDATFGLEPARDGHNSFETALEIFTAIEAKQVALTHVNHTSLGEADFRGLRALKDFCPEKVVVAEDGMQWEFA